MCSSFQVVPIQAGAGWFPVVRSGGIGGSAEFVPGHYGDHDLTQHTFYSLTQLTFCWRRLGSICTFCTRHHGCYHAQRHELVFRDTNWGPRLATRRLANSSRRGVPRQKSGSGSGVGMGFMTSRSGHSGDVKDSRLSRKHRRRGRKSQVDVVIFSRSLRRVSLRTTMLEEKLNVGTNKGIMTRFSVLVLLLVPCSCIELVISWQSGHLQAFDVFRNVRGLRTRPAVRVTLIHRTVYLSGWRVVDKFGRSVQSCVGCGYRGYVAAGKMHQYQFKFFQF